MLKQLNGVKLFKFEPQVHTTNIYAWYYDENYKNFFRSLPSCPTLEEIAKMVAGKAFMVIYEGLVVGMCMYYNEKEHSRNVEISLLIDVEFQHSKIGLSAIKILINYLLNTLNLYKVTATVLESDERINSSLEKIGFKQEGKFKNHCYVDGTFHNENFWAITKSEFNKKYIQDFTTVRKDDNGWNIREQRKTSDIDALPGATI